MKKLLAFLFMFGCASTDETRRIYIDKDTYVKTMSDSTKSSQQYSGFQNVLDIRLTLLNAKVREAMTLKKATNFQWTDSEMAKERENGIQQMSSETRFFMSFFTPESKNDNLAKADTVWRIFLDVQGKRYSGTVTKVLETPSETEDLYPDHTKWGTPYFIKFLVPTRVVEESSSRVTITGPLGSTELNFNP